MGSKQAELDKQERERGGGTAHYGEMQWREKSKPDDRNKGQPKRSNAPPPGAAISIKERLALARQQDSERNQDQFDREREGFRDKDRSRADRAKENIKLSSR